MRSFFRVLKEHRVRYLLISGQATVLYGASTFSEDIDLWVDPSNANWQRTLDALEACSARVYKLTPPLERSFARGGHGFHFTLPDEEEATGLIIYLDVMGKPPRVGSFRESFRRTRWFDTHWGRLPVVALSDLALIKRTQRLSDYAVISALVRITCQQIRSRGHWEWGLNHTFDSEDLLTLWRRGKRPWRQALRSARPAMQLLLARRAGDALLPELSAALATEMEQARRADREYWRPIIAQLKALQKSRKLVKQGTPVAAARRVHDG